MEVPAVQTHKKQKTPQTGNEKKELMTDKNTQIAQSEGIPKRIKGNGAARFRKACERVLRRDSEKIAEALIHRACSGDLASARLLVRIIESRPRRRKNAS